MNRKKMIITINLLLIIIFFFFLEYCSYLIYSNEYKTTIEEQRLYIKDYKFHFSFLPQKVIRPKKYNDSFFADFGSKSNNKEGILILGSSYAAGLFLKKEETLAYKINAKTDMPTYCRAICGAGPQYMHYLLKNKLVIFDELKYIIYLYSPEHVFMLEKMQGSVMLPCVNFRYKLKGTNLEEINPIGEKLYSYYSVKILQNFLERIKLTNNIRNGNYYKKFNIIMSEIAKFSKEQYPNAKLIFLEYAAHKSTFPTFIDKSFQQLSKEEISYLEEIGYNVINLNSLTGADLDLSEYKAIDNDHPNEKATELISNEIVKYLKLSN